MSKGELLREAESLFRSKTTDEIRQAETSTRSKISQKQQELRQLVGDRYRDLIDSADSVGRMRTSSEAISLNLFHIDSGIHSLTPSYAPKFVQDPTRSRLYAMASRVKYLVDTPENIWGCLDEFMFFEASGRYLRARLVYSIINSSDADYLSKFALLSHQWQVVDGFKFQISQQARERLMDRGSDVGPYADALAAIATLDELSPQKVLTIFLDSRRSWISQEFSSASPHLVTHFISQLLCNIVKTIQATIGHVGELFLHVLNDMPLFYKTALGAPPGTQLFGGIPYPDEEVRLWKLNQDKLETLLGMLDTSFVSHACFSWLKSCKNDIVSRINGMFLANAIRSGEQLVAAEKMIRRTMDGRDVLEGSLEWLRSVFGSEIGSPWKSTSELVLQDHVDLWEEIFEQPFVRRMQEIIDSNFIDLNNAVKLSETIQGSVEKREQCADFVSYLEQASTSDWLCISELHKANKVPFSRSKNMAGPMNSVDSLAKYLGLEVVQIINLVDGTCKKVLHDLMVFFNSPQMNSRLKELVPYLQDNCFKTMSKIVRKLEDELEILFSALEDNKLVCKSLPPSLVAKKALLIGRFLFAFGNHSTYIPLVLDSPRLWWGPISKTSPSLHTRLPFGHSMQHSHDSASQSSDIPPKQSSSSVLPWVNLEDFGNSKLEGLIHSLRDLCIKAHTLWVIWVTDELSTILSKDLKCDDSLSAALPLRGWEEITIKHVQQKENEVEMKISLPSMPSLYVVSLLFRACQEINRAGGHFLDKFVLHVFAAKLLEKVLIVYKDMISTLENQTPQFTEKGILQIMFDLQLILDVLVGGGDLPESGPDVYAAKNRSLLLTPQRHGLCQFDLSLLREHVKDLICNLSQKLDPIDWATYESYFWNNSKQAYQRYTVLFGFLVQLYHKHTDTLQKLSINSESNIMRCLSVPRFKYLPISAPSLPSRLLSTFSYPTVLEDTSSRNSSPTYLHENSSQSLVLDGSSGFAVATPLFKSFMSQVGSKLGESKMKLGSMLTDSQVGKLKEKSVISSFGDILPLPAAGLLSSFSAPGRSDY